jgi:hypothetical protein
MTRELMVNSPKPFRRAVEESNLSPVLGAVSHKLAGPPILPDLSGAGTI